MLIDKKPKIGSLLILKPGPTITSLRYMVAIILCEIHFQVLDCLGYLIKCYIRNV